MMTWRYASEEGKQYKIEIERKRQTLKSSEKMCLERELVEEASNWFHGYIMTTLFL